MLDRSPRILVVDDELGICQNCVKILAKENYQVEYALNGYDALRMMQEEPFDVIDDQKTDSTQEDQRHHSEVNRQVRPVWYEIGGQEGKTGITEGRYCMK